MTVRGRLAQLPKGVAKQEKEIMHLYYDLGIKQKDIKEKLNLSSVSVVAEVLRRDAVTKVENFKKLDPKSEGYQEKAVEIIKFLKNFRKCDYSSISTILELPRETVFKIISDETSGLRNTLTNSEREDRNKEMIRLSAEEGLSVTEIGKRMGLSKQMVSRIFTDLGYKPIRGTRKVQITQKHIADMHQFIKDDCNAKLKELNDELRKVKGEAASVRQHNNRLIVKLRCKLIHEIAKNVNEDNLHELKIQSRYVKQVYDQFLETTNETCRPPYFEILEETVQLINKLGYGVTEEVEVTK